MTEKNEMTAEEVLKKFDKESNTMEYKGLMAKFVSALAISFSVFQLYTASFGILDAQLQRAIHLGFGLALAFLLFVMFYTISNFGLFSIIHLGKRRQIT